VLGRPLYFDFSGEPPEPDWLVDGLLERGTVTVLSADSGAGKSLLCKSMIVAMLQQRPWLGRSTHGQRAMVIDEENFRRVVHTRFRALGMTNDDRPNLRYFLRLGVQLGQDSWDRLVEEELKEFLPDVLIIDTASAATGTDVMDNSSVARLYSGTLRPLADACAVILLHHERKPQQGGRRHAGYAMMGARQWAGQADAHLALERLGDVESGWTDDGIECKRYPMKLEMPKSRDGMSVSENIVILSQHGTDGRPIRMRVQHA
jgi:RecA-family ATPase